MHRPAIATIFALACACSGSNRAPRKLVLLHTNDEHSHLLGQGPEVDDFPPPKVPGSGAIKGGVSRRSVLLNKERAAALAGGADVLTVSAGDNMMGTLVQIAETLTAPDYRSMGLLQYDVTTLGNHEFDYGPAALAKIIKVAKASPEGMPAIVSSNIRFSGTPGDAELQALFDEAGSGPQPIHRFLVKTTPNGLRVGFVGIMGADAAAVAPFKAPVKFSVPPGGDDSVRDAALAQIIDDLQPVVDSLRRDQKVDLVVALSHGGLDQANPAKSEDAAIAKSVSGIDVIVSGHTHTEARALVVNQYTGHTVMVQQAGRYGDNVGRIVLAVAGDGTVSFDQDNTALLKVDDNIVPSDSKLNDLTAQTLGLLESAPLGAGLPSYLQLTLTEILQAPQALPSTVGKLAFAPVVGLDFDIDNQGGFHETELLDLVADAELAAAQQLAPTDVAVTAAGELRVPLLERGKSRQLSFADLFRAVPLGASPKSGTPGYPLCRFGIYLAELKAAFEITAGYAYTGHEDLFLVPAGYKFEYDTSRPMFNPSGDVLDPKNGRVTKIFRALQRDDGTFDSYNAGSLVFDASTPTSPGWLAPPLGLVRATADLYITTFATFAGVHLKDANTGVPLANNDATAAILIRPDKTEIKLWEALGAYAHAQASGGVLPHRYAKGAAESTLPRRATCSGPLCVP